MGHPGLFILQQDWGSASTVLIPPTPNAKLRWCDCPCAVPHVAIEATSLIAQGSEVVLTRTKQANTFGYLIQFDGSYKKEHGVGGAGISIFRVTPGQVQFVAGFGFALAQCSDNLEAEAVAVSLGIELLADKVLADFTLEEIWHMPIFVQGDIQPVIRLLAHHGRIKRLDIVELLTLTQLRVAQIFRALRWQFLPREANTIADYYAGEAMRFASERASSSPLSSDVQVKIATPYHLLYRAGARISGLNSPNRNQVQVSCQGPC